MTENISKIPGAYNSYSSALRTGSTLLFSRRAAQPEIRAQYLDNKTFERRFPQNTSQSVQSIASFVKAHKDKFWCQSLTHAQLAELWKLSVQFSDDHQEPIDPAVLPSEELIHEYIDRVARSEGNLTVNRQFELLNDLSGGDVVQAGILGMVASRIAARGGDYRLYPSIHVSGDTMNTWASSVAQFEDDSPNAVFDPNGDTYYFWTHFTGAVTFRTHEGILPRSLDSSFRYGTQVMRATRRFVAGSPTITDHMIASEYGRQAGVEVAEVMKHR